MVRTLLTLLLAAIAAQPTLAQGGGLDIRVDGEGYLRFVSEGKVVYAKSASLIINNGRLGVDSGAKLVPAIEATSLRNLTVDLEGNVKQGSMPVGRIVLALFDAELQAKDAGGFYTSSSRPRLGDPGDGSNGVIRLAGSNNGTTTSPMKAGGPVKDHSSVKQDQVLTQTKTLASLAMDTPKVADSGSIEITVPDSIEADGSSFTLGEIASIRAPLALSKKLNDIVIGDTPPLGIDRIIERTKIISKIKYAGIDTDAISLIGPDKVRVTRKGQKIVQQQFVEAAIRGAQVKGYSVGLESVAPGPDIVAPLGDLQLVCESITGSNGEITATIGIYVDGKRFNSRSIKLKTTGAASNLKAGAIVKVRVVSHNVRIESSAKVVKVDQSTGLVTVQVVDTGATLTGTMSPDGILEVQA